MLRGVSRLAGRSGLNLLYPPAGLDPIPEEGRQRRDVGHESGKLPPGPFNLAA